MDYGERLSCLRAFASDADRAVDEINMKLNLICENCRVFEQLDTSDSSVRYLPLEHSKHKQFIKAITLISKISKNINQNMSALESTNSSRLRSSLQQEEDVYQRNRQVLMTLERVIEELHSFNPRLGPIYKCKNEENKI